MLKNNEITKYYKLPWTELDNPNGWIEPITKCNIVCPGCYRGADKETAHSEMLPLEELKKQIDWFKQHRNVHTISIAGGEPTLYPHLKELIAYAAQLNLRTMMFTNGYLLNREFAYELAKNGLNQVVIHVDRFQKRPDMIEITANELRQKFVDNLKDIPNLQLGFIQPVSQTCEKEIASLMEFSKKNFTTVNLLIFTIYRNICDSSGFNSNLDNNLTVPDLLGIIQKYAHIKPTAYLHALNDHKMPTWLFSQRMGVNGFIFGNVSSSLYKYVHQRYRLKNNRFLFISRSNSIKIISLFLLIYRTSVIKILSKYFYRGFFTGKWNKGNINFQTMLLLRGPEKQKEKWDLCEGCPDRMIYNGKILPSCILENIKSLKNEDYNNANI